MNRLANRVLKFAAVAAATCAFVAFAEGEAVKFADREVYVHAANYDKSKIPPYTLEDPLTFLDGRRVQGAADWVARREEILGLFAREMYGQPPPQPETVVTALADEKVGAAAGFAIRRQYRKVSPDPEGAEEQFKRAYGGVFGLWGPRNPKRTDNRASQRGARSLGLRLEVVA